VLHKQKTAAADASASDASTGVSDLRQYHAATVQHFPTLSAPAAVMLQRHRCIAASAAILAQPSRQPIFTHIRARAAWQAWTDAAVWCVARPSPADGHTKVSASLHSRLFSLQLL